jgi:hypothetical protein
MYDRKKLIWRKTPDSWELHVSIVTVVPDDTYPAMWRVRRPDGTLTDMANLTWARDGAVAIALGVLNRQVVGRAEPQSAGRKDAQPVEVG